MDSLPDDILLHHILPRLPSKSLIRCLCVCKSLASLGRHPFLLRLRQSPACLLFVSPDPHAPCLATSQPHVFSSPLHHGAPEPNNNISATLLLTLPNLKYSEFRVQCVNGLLCFHPRSNIPFSSHDDAFTLIVNPKTREVISLPFDDSIVREFLVSTHFGYDPVRDEFKVLRLVKYKGSHEFKVFTVGVDRSWRLVTPEGSLLPMRCLLNQKRGLCVNGAVHWAYASGADINNGLKIVAFDLGTEKFRVMPRPLGYFYKEGKIPHMRFPDLVEIDGCLSLIGYSMSSLSSLSLWILKDYRGQVWEQRCIVLPSDIVSPQRVVYPLCTVPTGEILLLPYFLPRRVKVIYYDTDQTSSRIGAVMEMPQPLWPDQATGEVDIFFYQESSRLLKCHKN